LPIYIERKETLDIPIGLLHQQDEKEEVMQEGKQQEA